MSNIQKFIRKYYWVIIPIIVLFIYLLAPKQVEDKDYDITIIDNFLTEQECDYIVEKARPNLKRSSVMGKEKSETSTVRTSTNTFLKTKGDPILENISKRVSEYNGKPVQYQESVQVVHYEPGQKYEHHFDACTDPKKPYCARDAKRGGLRYDTFFVYLNDVIEGGQTDFPVLGKQVNPVKGRAVYWRNLLSDNSTHHPKSKHAGLPPISGEKWGMNIWTRCCGSHN